MKIVASLDVLKQLLTATAYVLTKIFPQFLIGNGRQKIHRLTVKTVDKWHPNDSFEWRRSLGNVFLMPKRLVFLGIVESTIYTHVLNVLLR